MIEPSVEIKKGDTIVNTCEIKTGTSTVEAGKGWRSSVDQKIEGSLVGC